MKSQGQTDQKLFLSLLGLIVGASVFAGAEAAQCTVIEETTCKMECILITKVPVTVTGYAVSRAEDPGNWVEMNLFAYDRRTGNQVAVKTRQEPKETTNAKIDLSRGNYRIVADQKNYHATCVNTYVDVY